MGRWTFDRGGAGRRPPEVWSKESPVGVRGSAHRPNKRLKLAAPGLRGNVMFVIVRVARRSLSAIR